ncbi:MAG: amylo-alpha-1,6-glucosidase [Rhodothermales bacterium]|nr:amylo-alpha-1,6-glucosidase [Rhodothermales bacterium]
MTHRLWVLPTLAPVVLAGLLAMAAAAQPRDGLVPRFAMETSGLVLERPAQVGAFFDVLGRRAAVFGYENRPFEVWAYPLKLVSDFRLAFQLEDYPGAFDGLDLIAHVEVRPEATVLTYTHAAFTVRQILFAPIDEPGVVMLLDVDAVRPLTVTASFRPDLALMWPAGLMTGGLGWDAERQLYTIVEESRRFVGVLGAPGARDVSVMPYQEEPRDVPNRFVLEIDPETAAGHYYPILFAGSVEGREATLATYQRLRDRAPALYNETARYYRRLLGETLTLDTPDDRLDDAFAWAKVGTDKGLVTNPMLGTGFVAGYRTAGRSERPGFAWYFGRDALWTALALTAYGDFDATRTALDFLKQFQRADGRIPHEVSQSAALLPWFEDYIYPWASADATPLFLIAHADFWRHSGDLGYLRENWDALKRAYAFTKATDTDGDALVENTGVGHGWVEGGALYPAHQELYMQGLWIQAARDAAALAEAVGDDAFARVARADAARTLEAVEATYWLDDAGHYAFASPHPGQPYWNANTVMPGVPLWWALLREDRAQRTLDHLGAGALATDWGTRILTAESPRYDPLSYHNGSVWGLFTGWAAMGAYAYDRPHIGLQALMANALLTYQDALGYVTELLSGDFNTAFGRSSHHQIWSEAMVVTPAVRGLLGVEAHAGARRLRIAPQVPADWDRFALTHLHAGGALYDVTYRRGEGETRVVVERRSGEAGTVETIEVAPAFPLDAEIRSVTVDGRAVEATVQPRGDVQRAAVTVPASERAEIVYTHTPGTDVYVHRPIPAEGASNTGLRILRSRAGGGGLDLLVEGRGGRTYRLHARTPHRLGEADDVSIRQEAGQDAVVEIPFDGPADAYVRRRLRLPFRE